jgi:hypothetical protein
MGGNVFLRLLFVGVQSSRKDCVKVWRRGGSRRDLGHNDTCGRTRVGCPSSSSRDKIDKRHGCALLIAHCGHVIASCVGSVASIGALQFVSSGQFADRFQFSSRVSLFSSNHILSVFLCLAINPDLRSVDAYAPAPQRRRDSTVAHVEEMRRESGGRTRSR